MQGQNYQVYGKYGVEFGTDVVELQVDGSGLTDYCLSGELHSDYSYEVFCDDECNVCLMNEEYMSVS